MEKSNQITRTLNYNIWNITARKMYDQIKEIKGLPLSVMDVHRRFDANALCEIKNVITYELQAIITGHQYQTFSDTFVKTIGVAWWKARDPVFRQAVPSGRKTRTIQFAGRAAPREYF